MSKKARLLAAAHRNDVQTLKQLLDAPMWYRVRDKYGCNLLHIAILRENDQAFDYLLSLDEFPLEVALSHCNIYGLGLGERYVYELIKKGADINKISHLGQPLLHCTLENGFVRVARLLIERGADVNMLNHEGETPLHKSLCFHDGDLPEAIMMLLCYGADPTYCGNSDRNIFEYVALCKCSEMSETLENLFFFTFDELSSYKFRYDTLLELAQKRSPVFHQIIKLASEIICEENLDFYCLYLFTVDSEYLEILLDKYPKILKQLLQSFSEFSFWYVRNDTFILKNFEMLMQNPLLDSDTIQLISKLNSYEYEIIPYILNSGENIDETMGVIYYLLSYGMPLYEKDLENIYKKTGYSEDFKNLLFLDVKKQIGEQITKMMPRLIYDVTLDIHKIVENPSLCQFIDWEEIFNYFVHPKIQNAYRQIKSEEVIGRQLPEVPLLQELSRDSFRKYFVKTFKITTAKQFYSLIKLLPISPVHGRILTFESKLY